MRSFEQSRRHTAALAMSCVFILAQAAATALAAPTDPSAVLARFVGEWKTHTHIRRAGTPPREFDTRGKAVCKPTLEGRYFEFRSESIPPGDADLQIMTFDEEKKVFRQWVFSSDGYQHEAAGTWDAATSTLRWTGKTADSTFIILDRWRSPDRLEWTLERTGTDGKQLQTIEGTLVREAISPAAISDENE
jgi:hypothetical protein